MSRGHFKVKQITHLDEIAVGDTIYESDFSLTTNDNKFIQFEYVEEDEEVTKTILKPGVFSMQVIDKVLRLVPTQFKRDKVLRQFMPVDEVSKKINNFLTKLPMFAEEGIANPRRGFLLYGPAGTGKSTLLSECIHGLKDDGKTCIISWQTDSLDASDVKRFFRFCDYSGVSAVVLIMEDIGGIEVSDVSKPSEPSLLSLLDNEELIFKCPVLFLATTNYPEIFMGNLTNRPGRFDQKIKVDHLTNVQRVELLKFFLSKDLTEDVETYLKHKDCDEMSTAHLKESIFRSKLNDISLLESLKEITTEIKEYKAAFAKARMAMGF